MSIIYLCISNQNSKSIIGSYNPVEIEKSSIKELIENKTHEIHYLIYQIGIQLMLLI